jgi:hypothetical protein
VVGGVRGLGGVAAGVRWLGPPAGRLRPPRPTADRRLRAPQGRLRRVDGWVVHAVPDHTGDTGEAGPATPSTGEGLERSRSTEDLVREAGPIYRFTRQGVGNFDRQVKYDQRYARKALPKYGEVLEARLRPAIEAAAKDGRYATAAGLGFVLTRAKGVHHDPESAQREEAMGHLSQLLVRVIPAVSGGPGWVRDWGRIGPWSHFVDHWELPKITGMSRVDFAGDRGEPMLTFGAPRPDALKSAQGCATQQRIERDGWKPKEVTVCRQVWTGKVHRDLVITAGPIKAGVRQSHTVGAKVFMRLDDPPIDQFKNEQTALDWFATAELNNRQELASAVVEAIGHFAEEERRAEGEKRGWSEADAAEEMYWTQMFFHRAPAPRAEHVSAFSMPPEKGQIAERDRIEAEIEARTVGLHIAAANFQLETFKKGLKQRDAFVERKRKLEARARAKKSQARKSFGAVKTYGAATWKLLDAPGAPKPKVPPKQKRKKRKKQRWIPLVAFVEALQRNPPAAVLNLTAADGVQPKDRFVYDGGKKSMTVARFGDDGRAIAFANDALPKEGLVLHQNMKWKPRGRAQGGTQ